MTAEQDSRRDEAVDEVEVGQTAKELDNNDHVGESATKGKEPPEPRFGGLVRRIRLPRIGVGAVVLAVLVIASLALAAWLFYFQYQSDQKTNTAAAENVTRAASDGTVALLTYSPKTLDKDLTTAKSHLTGDFLAYYSEFTDEIVAPAAKQKEVQTTANVARAAVSELHADSAVVLLFVNQTTVSKERPAPAMSASSVKVTLSKINGAWLISKFEPL